MFQKIINKIKSVFSPSTPKQQVMSYQWDVITDSYLLNRIEKIYLPYLSQASDLDQIWPNFKDLPQKDKIVVLKEFLKWVAFFESGWNPKSESVDVGNILLKDTWSVGLYQLSVTDQKAYGFMTNYSYSDLKDPLINSELMLLILSKQVMKYGKILIPKGESGVYWAVIHPGGKYDHTNEIIHRTRLLKLSSNPEGTVPLIDNDIPWMSIAKKERGVKEKRGGENPRIIEYHAATSLKATEDEVAWCSAFVTWCLEQAKCKSTKSAWARSYLNYGEVLKQPKYGCILIFSRGKDSGHVGFYMGEDETKYYVLGGNQGDEVNVSLYAKDNLLGCRWPIKKDV
jgi:uncharacterized protein (TIGR02594 family)